MNANKPYLKGEELYGKKKTMELSVIAGAQIGLVY